MPTLIREALFAPTVAPEEAALLWEAARTHHDDGELERAIEVYGLGLRAWETHATLEALSAAQLADSDVRAEAARIFSEADDAVATAVRKAGTTTSVDAVAAAELAATKARILADAEAHALAVTQRMLQARTELLEPTNGGTLYVPLEGRVYFHLAVAAVFETAGQDERALREYLEAARLLKAEAPTAAVMSPTAALVQSCLGTVHFHLSQYDFAADYTFRALEIREALLPPGHVDVGVCLNNAAAVLLVLGRVADATVLLNRAEGVFALQLPPHHPRRWVVSTNVGIARRIGFLRPGDAEFPDVPYAPWRPTMIPGAEAANDARLRAAVAAAAAKKPVDTTTSAKKK
jgi:tetratricopeptide (TPR) repeat protein